VNNLPKTVTWQRRGCDLNPGSSAPDRDQHANRPSHPFVSYYLKINIKTAISRQKSAASHKLSELLSRVTAVAPVRRVYHESFR